MQEARVLARRHRPRRVAPHHGQVDRQTPATSSQSERE